jgi:MFS family permease
LATYTIFRVVDRTPRLGRVLLIATVAYGVSNIFLAQAHLFVIAVLAGLLIGACDAMATTIRQAAVQLETPDELRGRVSAIYQMASRGGPAVGDTVMGGVAGLLGPVVALTLGGALAVVYAGGFLVRSNPVLAYTGVAGERDGEPAVSGKQPESG